MTLRGESRGVFILQIMLLMLAFCGNILARETGKPGQDDDTVKLNRIEVTGSRIKRTDLEGPANVIVIDRAQIDARGYTTVFEALSDLTVNNGVKFEGPETLNGFSPDVQTLNLRGFGVGSVTEQ